MFHKSNSVSLTVSAFWNLAWNKYTQRYCFFRSSLPSFYIRNKNDCRLNSTPWIALFRFLMNPRVVIPSIRRTHHISPILKDLHWLPVRQRITFKIACLTYKAKHLNQPPYLAELLTPYKPSRNLRSSDKNLLLIPFVKNKQAEGSFSFAAPTIWNSLLFVLHHHIILFILISKLFFSLLSSFIFFRLVSW